MSDELILRQKARDAVRNGKLPARRPDRTWGGPGVGAPCTICDKPVTRAEMEFEIQFEHDGAMPGLDKFHVTSGASPHGSWNGRRRRDRWTSRPWTPRSATSSACTTCGYIEERRARAAAVETALRHCDARSAMAHVVTIENPEAPPQ